MRSVETIQRRIEEIRRRAYTGSAIRMHRAIASVRLRRRDVLAMVLLPPAFDALMLLSANAMTAYWSGVVEFWRVHIGLDSPVVQWPADFGGFTLWLPNVALDDQLPGNTLWWSTLVVCALLWMATSRIASERYLPLSYIIRALVLIQGSALVFFGLYPASFPFEASHYLARSLSSVVALMLLVPWLLAAIYHIFDFPFWEKAALTGLAVGYLALIAPFQYMLHVWILWKGSGLFLPLLYICFGTVVEILVLLGLYSWAMTWPRKSR